MTALWSNPRVTSSKFLSLQQLYIGLGRSSLLSYLDTPLLRPRSGSKFQDRQGSVGKSKTRPRKSIVRHPANLQLAQTPCATTNKTSVDLGLICPMPQTMTVLVTCQGQFYPWLPSRVRMLARPRNVPPSNFASIPPWWYQQKVLQLEARKPQ
jgi:hypothetical protein